jgi:hypothetical protein
MKADAISECGVRNPDRKARSLIPIPHPEIIPATFPQQLWKTLWKNRFLTLQVPDNFRLLAFCTSSRQSFAFPFQRPLKPWTLNALNVAIDALR